MRILFLGNNDSPLISFLKRCGESVVSTADPISVAAILAGKHDFLISYGFRHILKEDVLSFFPNRAINLHISLLPWNRGADPNLWSFLENTPKGVTIHCLDKGVDTGNILIQREVDIPKNSTLRSSYDLLQNEIQNLFCANWEGLKAGTIPGRRQSGASSVHRLKDKLAHQSALRLGFDTPVQEIEAYGRTIGLEKSRVRGMSPESPFTPSLLLRADAGPNIGFGHLTRCLTLGRAWIRRGGLATLLTAGPTESLRLRATRYGIPIHGIPLPHPHLTDVSTLKNEPDIGSGSWIVIDGYNFDAAYISAARASGARVLVIEDGVRLSRYDADLILDQNLGAESRNYGINALLGTPYVLLRPEFSERARPKRFFSSACQTLLISLGGGDCSRAVNDVLDAIKDISSGLEIVVALGPDSTMPDTQGTVRFERDPDMPALMEWADIAILAGGITSWEASYMGLPAIYTPTAENQRPIARALAAAGAGLYAEGAPSLVAAVASLLGDANRRATLSASAQALVDGQGAQRVIGKMLSLSEISCL